MSQPTPEQDILQQVLPDSFDLVQYGLELEGPAASASWTVLRLTCTERISAPYSIELEITPNGVFTHAHELLGQAACVTVTRDQRERTMRGRVVSVEDRGEVEHAQVLVIVIMPELSLLQQVKASRIFEQATASDIVKEVYTEAGKQLGSSAPFDPVLRLDARKLPTREYTVQYQESDYAFMSRLLAEEGIWFCFSHEGKAKDAEKLLLINDEVNKAPRLNEGKSALVVSAHGSSTASECITSFSVEQRTAPTILRLHNLDWTAPSSPQDEEYPPSSSIKPVLHVTEYGGVNASGYEADKYKGHDTKDQARIRLQSLRADSVVYHGLSNAIGLRAGHVAFIAASISEKAEPFLITSVTHLGDTARNTLLSSNKGGYRNEFTCVRVQKDPTYRPPLLPKPVVPGIETALVVDDRGDAPAGKQPLATYADDAYSRVRVKFPWDTTPRPGGKTSCRIRVAQTWAGAGWGSQFIPRVGMEVVVQFLGGDPDRPVITGCLYNQENLPPYAKKESQSGIKTSTVLKPDKYNELRFDDTADKEQIFVHASKDYVEDVVNDHTTTVGGKQTQTVKKSQTEAVHGNATLTVRGKRTKTVGGDKEHGEEITIKGEQKTTVTKKHTGIFQDEHDTTVEKKVTETYNLEHNRKVKGPQNMELETDKTETIKGSYALTTDTAFRLTQGASLLTFEGDQVALTTKGPYSIDVNGSTTLDIDGSGNLAIKANTSISLEVGGNKIAISMSGIEISAMQVAITAGPSKLELGPAGATLSGPMTTVEGQTMCAVKGAIVQLNS